MSLASFRRLLPLLLALIACGSVIGLNGAGAQIRKSAKRPRDISQFRKQHEERREKFAAALEEIAKFCDEKQFAADAARIRLLAQPLDNAELRVNPLPRDVLPPLAGDLPADEKYWRTQLRFQQQDYAKDLYLLSRHVLNAGHVGYAYDLIREVALNDSDHSSARKILGFVRNGDEWVSGFESNMLKAKKVWHEQFGWIPKEHVERYERGERYFKSKWISAAKENELRRDFALAWEIRTEHYLIKTNHSLERGVELAKKLEDYHGLFFQLMAGFFNNPEQVQQLFAGNSSRPAGASKPNTVHYYRARDEYLAALKKETNQPVEITKGMYFPRSGIAFFFYDPDSDDDSTLYHEATHQLLSGSRPQTGEIGMKSDFWIIEGIACYMESFHRDGEKFSVGDPAHGRLQAARAHFVNEQYYVPLREFARMGMQPFQTAKEIRKNYSQGAALTHFFMHYDGGRYREALIEYLSQIYSPTKALRENPDSLEELTGVSSDDLDSQYAEYIRNLGSQVTRRAAAEAE